MLVIWSKYNIFNILLLSQNNRLCCHESQYDSLLAGLCLGSAWLVPLSPLLTEYVRKCVTLLVTTAAQAELTLLFAK